MEKHIFCNVEDLIEKILSTEVLNIIFKTSNYSKTITVKLRTTVKTDRITVK